MTDGLEAAHAYMSPEQARGEELDAGTDLFSLGVVLYEMATARTPFRSETSGAVMGAILHDVPEPPCRNNPELPPRLEEIIEKAIEKDSDVRYQYAGDLRADLKLLKHDLNSGQVSSTPTFHTSTAGRKRYWKTALAGAALLISAGILAALMVKPLPPPRILTTTQITSDGLSKIVYVTDGARLYYTTAVSPATLGGAGSWGRTAALGKVGRRPRRDLVARRPGTGLCQGAGTTPGTE